MRIISWSAVTLVVGQTSRMKATASGFLALGQPAGRGRDLRAEQLQRAWSRSSESVAVVAVE